MEFRVEIQLRAALDLYAALVATGRRTHPLRPRSPDRALHAAPPFPHRARNSARSSPSAWRSPSSTTSPCTRCCAAAPGWHDTATSNELTPCAAKTENRGDRFSRSIRPSRLLTIRGSPCSPISFFFSPYSAASFPTPSMPPPGTSPQWAAACSSSAPEWAPRAPALPAPPPLKLASALAALIATDYYLTVFVYQYPFHASAYVVTWVWYAASACWAWACCRSQACCASRPAWWPPPPRSS